MLAQVNAALNERYLAEKKIPDFAPGDLVSVQVKVVEGQRERLQNFEGVCIGRSGAGVAQSFTLRKISHGEGVERVFPLYSPLIADIKRVRRGRVRRAKLYYLRPLRGKAARIAEKSTAKSPAASDKTAGKTAGKTASKTASNETASSQTPS